MSEKWNMHELKKAVKDNDMEYIYRTLKSLDVSSKYTALLFLETAFKESARQALASRDDRWDNVPYGDPKF